MIRYIVCLLLLATVGHTATYEITKTIPGDYATLAIAEAAWDIDLVAGDSSITFNITAAALEGATTIDGAVTNATHFLTVTTSGSARHAGVWSASAYRLSATYRPLYLDDDFIVIDGIQVEAIGTADSRFSIDSRGNEATIKNCIVRHESTGSNFGGGIYLAGTGVSFVFNNIIYDTNDAPAERGINCQTSDGDSRCYNNTIVNFIQGINGGFLNAVAINNIIWGCEVPVGSEQVYGSSPYSHHNATDSSSFSYGAQCGGNCGAGDITGMSDPFVDLANQNFLLANGSSDPAEDGSSESGVLTTDILGTSRPQSTNWDIGAHEYPAGEPGGGWQGGLIPVSIQ